jgi:hypothetical protein
MSNPVVSGSPGALTVVGVTGTAVQLAGGGCRSVIIAAKAAIAALSIADNTDSILIGVGSAPTWSATPSGIILQPGQQVAIDCADSSLIWINGVAGDGVTFNRLF